MTGLVVLLILSNLTWFTAYWLKSIQKKRATQSIRVSANGERVEVAGYSTRETVAILETLERGRQQ